MRNTAAIARSVRPVLRLLAAFGLSAALACSATSTVGPSRTERAQRAKPITAAPWPEADALFRRDARWLGGDAAISVPLDGERVLWLFGDSFVSATGERSRARARMVRNSVGLQRGHDPSRAEIAFFYGRAPDGTPASFFAEHGTAWFWPGHGVLLDGALTLFVTRIEADTGSALGFRVAGWGAVRVHDPAAAPDAWRPQALTVPDTGEIGIVGASVLVEGDFVYAYAVREPGDHAVLLLRWPRSDFVRGELLRPEWFGGEDRGFAAVGPVAVIAAGATEFSITRAPRVGYVQVQSRGFGAAPIALRTAPSLVGPFGPPADVYLPEEAGTANILLYAGRAHPELSGADLVLTYASNTLDPNALLADLDLYFPRFVRLTWR